MGVIRDRDLANGPLRYESIDSKGIWSSVIARFRSCSMCALTENGTSSLMGGGRGHDASARLTAAM